MVGIKEIHETLANLLVILALLHMTAALVHHIVFRDGTLKCMLPHLRNADLDQAVLPKPPYISSSTDM